MPRSSSTQSSSSSFPRKIHPAKRALKLLASKLQSKLTELRDRITHVVSPDSSSSSTTLLAKSASYHHPHSHYEYISNYYTTTKHRRTNHKLLHHHHNTTNYNNNNNNVSAIYIDHLYSEEASSDRFDWNRADDHETTTVRGKGADVVISGYKRPPFPRGGTGGRNVNVDFCSNDDGEKVVKKKVVGVGGESHETAPCKVQRRKKRESSAVVIVEENGYGTVETLEDAWRQVVARSPQLRPVEVRADDFIHNFQKIQKDLSIVEYQEMLARGL